MVGAVTSKTAWEVVPPIASGVCAVKTLSDGCGTPAMSGAPFGQIGTCSSPDGATHAPTLLVSCRGGARAVGAGCAPACVAPGTALAKVGKARAAARSNRKRPIVHHLTIARYSVVGTG